MKYNFLDVAQEHQRPLRVLHCLTKHTIEQKVHIVKNLIYSRVYCQVRSILDADVLLVCVTPKKEHLW